MIKNNHVIIYKTEKRETVIHFVPIHAENEALVLHLEVYPSQRKNIERVQECLDEAHDISCWRPLAIMNDQVVIGFAMVGLWENEGDHGRVWLDRFLIDARYQGKGFAKKALPLLIDLLRKMYQCNEIYLSVYESNETAIHLYQSIGFEFNGELDINQEKVMVLKEVV